MDEPVTQLVQFLRSGVSRDWLSKSASCFTEDDLSDIPRHPDYALLKINALGDFEYSGCNLNADAFTERGGRFQLESPKQGCASYVDVDVGNVQTHPTFTKFAKVFRDHNNKDTDPSFGTVLKSAHNDRMKRVELIIRVKVADFADDLAALDRGDQMSWSMSAAVPYDYCSICGNRAKRASEYCEHIRENRTQITKRGHVVCMLNDHMRFFDISRVRRPADRIALTLRKVAGADAYDNETGAQLASLLGLRLPGRLLRSGIPLVDEYRKLACKLADIEKQVPATVSSAEYDACGGDRRISDEEMGTLRNYPPDDVLRELDRRKIMISLGDLMRLTLRGRMPPDGIVDEAQKAVPGMFSRLLDEARVDDVIPPLAELPCFGPVGHELSRTLDSIGERMSLDSPAASRRMTIVIIRGGNRNPVKMAQVQNSLCTGGGCNTMVDEYARYQLRFCRRIGADDGALRRLVLGNHAHG